MPSYRLPALTEMGLLRSLNGFPQIKLNKEQLLETSENFTCKFTLFYIYLILCQKLIEYMNETATTIIGEMIIEIYLKAVIDHVGKILL